MTIHPDDKSASLKKGRSLLIDVIHTRWLDRRMLPYPHPRYQRRGCKHSPPWSRACPEEDITNRARQGWSNSARYLGRSEQRLHLYSMAGQIAWTRASRYIRSEAPANPPPSWNARCAPTYGIGPGQGQFIESISPAGRWTNIDNWDRFDTEVRLSRNKLLIQPQTPEPVGTRWIYPSRIREFQERLIANV